MLCLICLTCDCNSAFLWLLSIIIPAFFADLLSQGNKVIIPVLVASVLFQEISRFIFVHVYVNAERTIVEKTGQALSPYSDWTSALSAGAGIAIMYTLVIHGGIISATFDEPRGGDFYSDDCPDVSLYWISAINALLFQALHLALSILTFDAFRKLSSKKIRCAFIVLLHMGAALSTLINQVSCVGGPIVVAVVVVISWIGALKEF